MDRASRVWLVAVLPFQILSALILSPCESSATPAKTLYSYTSAPGDYIGGGSTNTYTASNATISVNGTKAFLTLTVSTPTEFWFVELAAPSGEKLRPGRFYNAERASFRTGRAPGLDVSGDGRGCNEVWGTFTINQISADVSGKVAVLDATFMQQCELPTAPVLTGVVKFNALPLRYVFASDPGDYIGGGIMKTYEGGTSIFSMSGSAISLLYSVSGERDNWTASISAPAGQTLKPGNYTTARFADSNHAGLDVFGDGRGCSQSTGTLTIIAIGEDGQGAITGLHASFVQHCEGGAAALHGKVRFYE